MPRKCHRERIEATHREAAELVRRAAAPIPKGEKVKVSIARAAAALRWTYSRTENIWHQEAKRIDAWEMDMLREFSPRRRRRRKAADQT